MPQKSKRPFFKRKWFKRIFLVGLVWLLVHITWITIDGLTDSHHPADVAIILGNKVFRDSSLSFWLKGRVDKALELYRQGQVKKIYASGGMFTSGEDGAPEGDAMKKYLVEHGVPAEDVIADNYGKNTYCTAKDFIAWNQRYHYTSAIVVSQFYHITRSKYILRKLGFKNVYKASSDVYAWQDVMSTLREVPAFYKYLIVY